MRRSSPRRTRLAWDPLEHRSLLSGIIASMATQALVKPHHAIVDSGFPQSQGPFPGATEFFNPTGTPTPHEVRRQAFNFTLVGPYIVGPGRFSSQLLTIYIRGNSKSNYYFEGDGQIGMTVPTDPNALVSGQATFFDRNINANSVFGLDLAGSPSSLDSQGRPTQLVLSTDVNISSGIFVESLSQGIVKIRYVSSGQHQGNVLDSGKAFVTIRGTAYTLGTANILRNTQINP
jgi:hypothetical protein